MILANDLTKHYGPVRALTGLTFEILRGEVFGLLGPNGSGKTTAIRLLLGMLKPTRGTATVAGFDVWKESLQVRSQVSYLPGELRLFGALTGLATLKYLSGLRNGEALDRAVAIAERVMQLDLSRKVRTYSTGMKQKLALAQTFADPVDILILDEPTSALDPTARREILHFVSEAKQAGQTIIFSGHVLSEVEQICDRVGIMRLGHLVHLEDMHARRSLRMLLLRFDEGLEGEFPDELNLTIRSHEQSTYLLEHTGELGPLLCWLSSQNVAEIAIGTEDLNQLYERFHGADAELTEDSNRV